LVCIEHHQLLLKGIAKQCVAMLPQEHQQLGTADALHDGVFGRRQLDGRMPEGWMHGKPSCWNGKKMVVSHAITSWKNTRPMF